MLPERALGRAALSLILRYVTAKQNLRKRAEGDTEPDWRKLFEEAAAEEAELFRFVAAYEAGWRVCRRCSDAAGRPVLKPKEKFYKSGTNCTSSWCQECIKEYVRQKKRLAKGGVGGKMDGPS